MIRDTTFRDIVVMSLPFLPLFGILSSFFIRDIVGVLLMFIVVIFSFLHFPLKLTLFIDLILFSITAFTAARKYHLSSAHEVAFVVPVSGVICCFYLLVS